MANLIAYCQTIFSTGWRFFSETPCPIGGTYATWLIALTVLNMFVFAMKWFLFDVVDVESKSCDYIRADLRKRSYARKRKAAAKKKAASKKTGGSK